ncbi:MAG: DUF4345 family protein [Bacteroidia bacterium]
MKFANYFFYYGYIGTVILAGFWGAFLNPYFDYRLLFHFDTQALPDYERINMLSQYRFLRAIELGFGLFAVLFVKNIFTEKKFNILFLIIMSSGILARVTSIIFDGLPSGLMFFFGGFELVGVVTIFFYSRKLVKENVIS